jgi:hypothetical protein
MRFIYSKPIQTLVILFFTALPLSSLVAQFKLDLRQHLYAPFLQDKYQREELIARRDAMADKLKWQKNALAQQDSNLTLIGLWPWGPCVAVAAKNNHAFIGNGGLFQVFDISNPVSPQIIGELFFGGLLVYDIGLSGNFAYIADGDMKVIDLSQPTRPQIAAKVTVPNDFAHRLIVSRNYAYVGTVRGRLIIVDISIPVSPIVKSTTVLNNEFVMGMAISGQHLFLSTESPIDPIYIYDVSDPSNPTLAGTYAVRNSGFTTAGKYLYLYTSGNNFQILDVSVPTSPQLVGSIRTPFAGRIAVKDGLTYVIARNPLLGIIDVSDPSRPVLRGTAVGTAITPASLAVTPPVVVAANEIGFWIIDASDLDHPLALTHFATGDAALKVKIVENIAYLACLKAGLFIAEVFDLQKPRFISSFSVGGWVDDIVVDSLVYLSGYPFGGTTPPLLSIVNVTKPGNPQMVAQVFVLSILPPPLGGLGPTALAISENYAFVTHNWGFSIINVSDKFKPQLVKWIATQRGPLDIAVSGKFVCLANGELGLKIFDISDPENPQEKFVFPGFAAGVTTRYDTAFVALSGGLTILEILSSGSVIKLGEVATPGSRSTVDIALQDNFAYMAYNEEVVVVDFSNPSQPRVVDHTITLASAWGVAVKSNHVFVTGGAWALQIYQNKLVTRVEEERFDPLPFSPKLYPSYPNPLRASIFNSLTTIEYEIPRPGQVEIKVFNSLGEEVANLVNGQQNSGRHRIFFDAKNLPTGGYFYRLRFNNNWQATQKLLIVK